MSDDRWERIEALLDEALDLDAARIPSWLEGIDPVLRPELSRLLRAHGAAKGFLEAPAAAMAAQLVGEVGREGREGDRLGPYRIVRELGRGGMGTVYLAHRDDLGMDVALKLLSHSVSPARLVRGFLSERRILAGLEHPNIARLLDAGLTESGTPYFVMERIDGESLTDYCDSHSLDVRERLRIFGRVCDAVEYAHQRLVVHRDLKPSNVMVTSDGAPKLLDFGIAKVLESGAPESGATHTVGQFMTPQYASPEQIRGEPVGTSTDVYSLGVLLYELLAGRPPHVVAGGTPFAAGQTVLETEPAALPRGIPEEVEGEVATRRSTTPRKLRQLLAGDLETIVAQAMHKDRGRRYPGVAALAEDVRRHLQGRPVVARGDSFAYRSDRFVRRNALSLILGTAALATAVGFAVFHTQRMAAERDHARTEAATAQSVSDFLVSIFAASDPDQPEGADLSAQDLLERGVARVRDELADETAVRARLLDVLGTVQGKRGRFREAEPLLEEALALRRESLGNDHVDVIQSLTHLSTLRGDLSDWAGATDLAQQAYDLSAKVLGPQNPETVYRLHNLGLCLTRTGDLERAEAVLRKSLEERRRLLGDENVGVANAILALANVTRDRGRYEEAAALYEEALALSRRVYGDDHPRVASAWNNLARLYARTQRWDDAERCATEALRIRQSVYGERNPRVIPPLGNLAALEFERGRFQAADSLYLELLALVREAYGPDHEEAISVLRVLGRARDHLERPAEAESLLTASVGMAERTVGVRHAEWAQSSFELGSFLVRHGRAAAAVPPLEAALAVQREAWGEDDERVGRTRIALEDALRRAGEPRAAEGDSVPGS